jgi:uncharacterized protein (DUF58 family)
LTRRGKLAVLGGVAVALVVVGLFVRDGRVLVLSFPFVVMSAALILFSPPRAVEVSVSRDFSTLRLEEGEELRVVVTVENRGGTLPLLGVAERMPDGTGEPDGKTGILEPLASGARREFSYTLTAPRGAYRFDGLDVTVWDRLGLSARREHLSSSDEVLVQPHVEPFEEIAIRPRRTRGYAGMVKANRGGSGLDFYGCRAYVSGDEVRRINWRAYGRRGELVVNEYEQEQIADVTVILDARQRAHTQSGAEGTFPHAVRAAASLAAHFLARSNGVGLLIYGDFLNWTLPGYGKIQRERILDALARACPGDKAVFEDLYFIPTRLFPPQSQLVFVTPLVGEEDVEVIGVLRARGYEVLLVRPDLLPFELRRTRGDRSHDLARRILEVRQALLLSTLSGLGVAVLNWDVTRPLGEQVAWRLSRRGRRSR